jgi:Gp157 protein
LERLESRAEQKRVLVSTALQEAGIRKLVAAEFTAYLRPSPSKVIVTDETLIPDEFWVSQQPRLDRQQLLAAVRSGREVPGAVLANSELTLAVRSQ